MSVHRDCVARVCPGALRSRAYKRDRRFLATASSLELLEGLPLVGKAFDKSLISGISPSGADLCEAATLVSRFSRCQSADLSLSIPLPGDAGKRFPYLLEGVRGRDAGCVRAFRQIHHLYAKLECPPDDNQVNEAIAGFVRRQGELPESLDRTPLVRCARDLIAEIVRSIDWTDIVPRHGPGALATGEKLWEKMEFKRIYSDLQQYYPADEYFYLNSDHVSWRYDEKGLYSVISPSKRGQAERIVHFVELPNSHCTLVAVPKDFRGPRIIAKEPLEKQWIQQGQRRVLVRELEQHPLTSGYVNFTSQDVNRGLALESSSSGRYATLDLKDASDRVSMALCSALIPSPALDYLRSSRSVAARLPSGLPVELRSFSPMGSAVCFPLESLIFYALSLSAIHCHRNPEAPFPPLRKQGGWRKYLGLVYVYGDDLIVDSEYSIPVIEALTSVGLVVNRDKCCLAGPFRESCGLDAFSGVDVTPIRFKHLPDRHTPSSFASSCAYLNRLRERCMMNSYDYLLEVFVNEFSTVPFLTCHEDPCGILTTSLTEAVNWNNSSFKRRYNKHLQQFEWLVTETSPVVVTHAINGWSQYLRAMTAFPNGKPDSWGNDDDEWSIPHALKLRKRWRTL